MADLDTRVAEAFHNAKANGYSFADAEAWAEDMVYCDAELEDEMIEDVKASIERQELCK